LRLQKNSDASAFTRVFDALWRSPVSRRKPASELRRGEQRRKFPGIADGVAHFDTTPASCRPLPRQQSALSP
jgi:hypothetical protein